MSSENFFTWTTRRCGWFTIQGTVEYHCLRNKSENDNKGHNIREAHEDPLDLKDGFTRCHDEDVPQARRLFFVFTYVYSYSSLYDVPGVFLLG